MLQMPNTIWMGKSCLVVNWQLYLLKRTERNHLKWGQESVIGKNYYVWRHYFGMNLTISVVFLLRNICLQCLCNFLLIYNFICIWCCFLVSPFILLSHHYVLQSLVLWLIFILMCWDYDHRHSPIHHSQSPRYARTYSSSPAYYSPSPRRRRYSRYVVTFSLLCKL